MILLADKNRVPRKTKPHLLHLFGAVFVTSLLLALPGARENAATPGAASVPEPKQEVTELEPPRKHIADKNKSGVAGVILRPRPPKEKPLDVRPPLFVWASESKTQSYFPFTGDYFVFPASNGHIAPDALVEHGTPIDSSYEVAKESSIQTQAFQPLRPALDLRGCRAIRVRLNSEETYPFIVSMDLIGNGHQQRLELGLYGFDPDQRSLDFALAGVTDLSRINGILMTFHHGPREAHKSARIAVRDFTLLP